MRLLLLAASLAATCALSGCYEETGAPAASYDDAGASAPDPATTAPAEGEPPRAYGNSQSTLGKAKDSAEGTIADLEARDRALQKQLDDQN